jgi:CheY-like chemotaxis protein
LKNIRVLVVEDVKLNQLLMKTLLDDFGFQRDIAVNGEIAIEKLKANSYDLVLMDLQMPVMDGFTATKYIREHISTTIPIIALTADVTTTDLQKCTEVGMNDYVSKPIDEKILYNKIVSNIHDHDLNLKAIPVIISEKDRLTDLAFMKSLTKEDPELMVKMLKLYTEQTAALMLELKTSLKDMNWTAIYSAAARIIPSFAIVGLKKECGEIAATILERAVTETGLDEIRTLVDKLDSLCALASIECRKAMDSLVKL